MIIFVNGEERDVAAANLGELWRSETQDLKLAGPKGFAMALNGALIRRERWTDTMLSDGDRVEIVRAMQGG